MKLLKRIKFALKYDFNEDFIVFSIPEQNAIRFLNYKDARDYSDKQIQYRPEIMVIVKEKTS